MTRIYKLLGAGEWAAAQAAGRFEGSEVDRRDGYIHFSTGAQVAETARRHFAGRDDLLLLGLDAEPLGETLRWEPSRGGDLFPHLYAPLGVAAVDEVRAIPLAADGTPDLGETP
ncbi:MAG TPA: DUF952 domain-containing protein [Phenylobacterium sp.]|nr:DUF952 domain-containing protein [Phenylobacterium sp.]